MPRLRIELNPIQSGLEFAFLTLCVLGTSTVDGKRQPEPSPRWSGVTVIVLTGIAAIFSVGFHTGWDFYAVGIIGGGTAALATLVWRFATSHSRDIGEARFGADLAKK